MGHIESAAEIPLVETFALLIQAFNARGIDILNMPELELYRLAEVLAQQLRECRQKNPDVAISIIPSIQESIEETTPLITSELNPVADYPAIQAQQPLNLNIIKMQVADIVTRTKEKLTALSAANYQLPAIQ